MNTTGTRITFDVPALEDVNAIDADALVAGVIAAVETQKRSDARIKTTPRAVAVVLPRRSNPTRQAAATRRAHSDALAVAS